MAARERTWMATIHGGNILVRQYPVLTPGEELTDNPPSQTMTLAEWQRRHSEFGCNVDGSPVVPRPGVGMRPDLTPVATPPGRP